MVVSFCMPHGTATTIFFFIFLLFVDYFNPGLKLDLLSYLSVNPRAIMTVSESYNLFMFNNRTVSQLITVVSKQTRCWIPLPKTVPKPFCKHLP